MYIKYTFTVQQYNNYALHKETVTSSNLQTYLTDDHQYWDDT